MLDEFQAHTGTTRDICRRLRLEVGVGLIVSMYGDVEVGNDGAMDADVPTPALQFFVSTLGRIEALGASLDIDQYVIAPDRDNLPEVATN